MGAYSVRIHNIWVQWLIEESVLSLPVLSFTPLFNGPVNPH